MEPLGAKREPKVDKKWNPERGMEEHVNKDAKKMVLARVWRDFGLHFGGQTAPNMSLKLSLFSVAILALFFVPKAFQNNVFLSKTYCFDKKYEK